MIIDSHTHISDIAFWGEKFIEQIKKAGKEVPKPPSLEEHFEAMKPVDKVLVLGFRSNAIGSLIPNEFIKKYVDQYPDKMIGVTCVDPHDKNAITELRHNVEEWGFKGLKLGPIYQHFYPNEKRWFPLYKTVEELGIPIIIHQGATGISDAPMKYALPIMLEEIAIKFPELKIIVAHLAYPWERELATLIWKQPNMYADISGFQDRPFNLYQNLVYFKEFGILDRLLFASDFPETTPGEAMDQLRNINRFAEGTELPKIPDRDIEALINTNAQRILKL